MYAIVVGDDRVAEVLTMRLVQAGAEVGLVAPRHADDLAVSLPSAVLVIRGEAGDARALEDAGARFADVVVASSSDDAQNMAACVQARRVFGIQRVVALSCCPDNAPAFEALDVAVVCSTTLIASALLARVGIAAEVAV